MKRLRRQSEPFERVSRVVCRRGMCGTDFPTIPPQPATGIIVNTCESACSVIVYVVCEGEMNRYREVICHLHGVSIVTVLRKR